MIELLIEKLHDPRFLAMLFAAIAAIATVLTLAMPLLAGDALRKRMKAVALEREKMRQRERERMARGEKVALRTSPKAVHADASSSSSTCPSGSGRRRRARSWCRPAIAARRPMSPSCSSAWSCRS